nr:hypothetical protein C5F59_30165 [Streptomyces sp. QL37]
MFMITAATAAPIPAGVHIFITVLGIAAVCYGGRWAFDIRGAIGATLARRRAAMEVKAQQTGNLGLTQSDGVGPSFFRFLGIVITAGGLVMLGLSAIEATT